VVGELELTFEVLYLAEDEGQRILVFSAEPGSPAALRLLAR
jgi:hypothetical protein